MDVRRVIQMCILFPLIATMSPPKIQIIDSREILEHPLCDMGCRCSESDKLLMDCSRAGLSKLPSSLEFESPLTVIYLQNNRLSSLGTDTFSRADGVEEMDLSLNRIANIANFTFTPFKSLAMLRISHNRLAGVGPGLLDGLSNLRVLEIGHNSIQKVVPEAFQGTPMLQELRMQYNPVFDLPEHMFQFLPNLEKLDLQETGLVTLPSLLFRPTPHLQWLSLAGNAFEKVPEDALAQAPLLESLDLSGNDFLFLERGDFRRLSRLAQLYLNNLSRLRRIEKDALAGLESLNTLSCSYNPKLEYLDQEAFGSENSTVSSAKASPHEQLYLRQNALRTLKSPFEMETWSTLSFVDLADNPWKCDCNLLWMRQLKAETQMNIVCDSPQHLRGRPFSTVDPSELKCEDKWALATFILIVSAMVVFALVILTSTVLVCSRSPIGLFVRAKKQFSYAKVVPKSEMVDLEWDPSADTI